MNNTYQRYLEKKELLEELAQKDPVYMIWRNAFESAAVPYKKLLRFMPRRVRETLYRYAQCGRMMAQREVCIACLCMEFYENIPEDWESIFLREAYEKEGRI